MRDGISDRLGQAPASGVKQAAEYAGGRGENLYGDRFSQRLFHHGFKCFEAADAVQNGADEIDMVVNIGWVKDGKYDEVLEEIKDVKEACGGKLLKVIIETLPADGGGENRALPGGIGVRRGFIKTSTGFCGRRGYV